jgi:hypothetical protein
VSKGNPNSPNALPGANAVCDSAVQTCPQEVKDCAQMKDHVQEGDIVLRGERGDDESAFIAKVSKCDYSHAGIVARDANGDLVVVDAYPGRSSGAVEAHSVDDFFCGHHATQGIITRPKDSAKAKKAAEWALEQTKDPDYEFDLFDPWNKDPKRLYCSDFVSQSFENAGLSMVPHKTDFLSAANRQNTLDAARDFGVPWYASPFVSDKKVEQKLLEKANGFSEYITPCDVARNANTDTVVNFNATAAAGSGSSKK